MRKALPHFIFLGCAISVYFILAFIEQEEKTRRGYSSLEGVLVGGYGIFLVCYIVVTAIVAGVIRIMRGRWVFGASYSIALVVTPMMFFLTWLFDNIMEDVQEHLSDHQTSVNQAKSPTEQ